MHKSIIKAILAIISSIIYLPHALVYASLPDDVKKDISKDAFANTPKETNRADGKTEISFHHLSENSQNIKLFDLAMLLSANQYLRTLFFHRIKAFKIKELLWGKKSGLEIPYDVRIGPGVILDHPFSSIINAKKIGSGLRIKNNITIGNKNDDESLRPALGDNVYIGAGSIVIGNIVIGNNVIIGAGSVVTKDLPDNCVAVGNPARIIRKWQQVNE